MRGEKKATAERMELEVNRAGFRGLRLLLCHNWDDEEVFWIEVSDSLQSNLPSNIAVFVCLF